MQCEEQAETCGGQSWTEGEDRARASSLGPQGPARGARAVRPGRRRVGGLGPGQALPGFGEGRASRTHPALGPPRDRDLDTASLAQPLSHLCVGRGRFPIRSRGWWARPPALKMGILRPVPAVTDQSARTHGDAHHEAPLPGTAAALAAAAVPRSSRCPGSPGPPWLPEAGDPWPGGQPWAPSRSSRPHPCARGNRPAPRSPWRRYSQGGVGEGHLEGHPAGDTEGGRVRHGWQGKQASMCSFHPSLSHPWCKQVQEGRESGLPFGSPEAQTPVTALWIEGVAQQWDLGALPLPYLCFS